MFDSIISESSQRYNLGDKAGSLLSSLLGIITDQTRGGFSGFLDRFRQIEAGNAPDSWVGPEDNIQLSNQQVERALGTATTDEMARQAGIDTETTKSALAFMIPRVVDLLTPNSRIPTEDDLLSLIGGYLSGVGGSTVSTTGVMANDALDRFGTAAAESVGRNDLVLEKFNEDPTLGWIAPLIILALMLILGWSFCSKSASPHSRNRRFTNQTTLAV